MDNSQKEKNKKIITAFLLIVKKRKAEAFTDTDSTELGKILSELGMSEIEVIDFAEEITKKGMCSN